MFIFKRGQTAVELKSTGTIPEKRKELKRIKEEGGRERERWEEVQK